MVASGRFGPCTVRYAETGVTRKRKMPPWEFRSRPTDTPLRKMNWAGAARYLRNFFRYPGFVKQIPSSFPFPVTQRVRHRSLIYIQFFPRSNLGEGEERGIFFFFFFGATGPAKKTCLTFFSFQPVISSTSCARVHLFPRPTLNRFSSSTMGRTAPNSPKRLPTPGKNKNGANGQGQD